MKRLFEQFPPKIYQVVAAMQNEIQEIPIADAKSCRRMKRCGFTWTVSVYRCPSSEFPAGHTSYLAIVGEHNCLRPQSGRMFSEIVDGLNNTVIVFETEPSKAVHWMCPLDASEDMFVAVDPKSKTAHQNGRHACMADGSVQFLSVDASRDVLRGLATIDVREVPYDSN